MHEDVHSTQEVPADAVASFCNVKSRQGWRIISVTSSRWEQDDAGALPSSYRACPDGGTCHHSCASSCWRVTGAVPLSGVYENDEWPAEVVEANPRPGPKPLGWVSTHYLVTSVRSYS